MNQNPLQTTIKQEVELEGVGLHTGNKCRLTFRPALANTGIRFFRADLPGIPMIPARLAFVVKPKPSAPMIVPEWTTTRSPSSQSSRTTTCG